MKQQPIDKETAKYNTVSSIADLLRETTVRNPYPPKPLDMSIKDYLDTLPDTIHRNVLFENDEHETVKRAFLRLVSEI